MQGSGENKHTLLYLISIGARMLLHRDLEGDGDKEILRSNLGVTVEGCSTPEKCTIRQSGTEIKCTACGKTLEAKGIVLREKQ